jgi:DNA polymerase-1
LKNMHVDNGDGTFTIYRMEEFNPDSPKQVGDRLIDIGWNPRKFTATGQPSTDKSVLGDAIDYLAQKVPEVEVLRKFNIVTHRNNKAKTWLELSQEDGRVHGRVNHVGPWTHRCSHFDDNMANISRVQLGKDGKPLVGLEGNYGWDSRHCWIPREGWTLVGADAAGIQLRALAHYIGDPEYIKEVCEGDVHVANQKAAGIKDRNTAKTFIYAWLLGAGDEKIGQIVGVGEPEYANLFKQAEEEYKWNRWRHEKSDRKSNKFDNLLYYVTDKLRSEGRIADKQTAASIIKGYFTKKQFLNNLPALKRFKEEDIPQAAKQGYMVGLDGRRIWVPSAHLAMGAYLQGFEAVVMKWSMYLYQKKLEEEGIPFTQVAFVHDEFCVETPPEYGEKVGKTIVWSIEEAGRILGSKCPLTGNWLVGESWAQVH